MSFFDAVLNPVYYAVSALMRAWHGLFSAFVDPSAAWVLAIVFLVVTLRAVLLVPAIAQLRSAATLRRIGPELTALRTRHADDPVRMLRETSALQRAHGASTWRTLLPALVQAPVFLGLLHVLQGFHTGTANYAFGPVEVASFLDARIAGVPLSAYAAMPATLLDGFGVDRVAVLAVAVPLLLLAAAATHLTMRQSLATSTFDGLRWLPWLAPAVAVVAGLLFPLSVGVLLYWLISNIWTLAQHRVGTAWVERTVPAPAPQLVPAAAPAPGATGNPGRRRSRSRSGRRKPRR
ncbi:membrane protein insertase YidC [Pseudonocardia sp. CA-107938]|uniref:membrane protein insertase YidC n=1 Tax=Pseudonocardia sp. CA-107938 TaxID=3240021 RepID=UPI003D916066